MREHRQHIKTVRTVDDDYTAWLDEDCHAWIGGDDFVGDEDFAAGVAAMRQAERDWWASAFDA